MDYDFSSLCVDQLEKMQKRLTTMHSTFKKEYLMALTVINSSDQYDHKHEIMLEVDDLLRDQLKKVEIFYTETFNKIQRALSQHL
jgi:hypothetical protein